MTSKLDMYVYVYGLLDGTIWRLYVVLASHRHMPETTRTVIGDAYIG